MATTDLVVVANRYRDRAVLSVNVTGVALDAAVSENFRIPAGFGDLLLEQLMVQVNALSGAYAAPTPAYDGFNIDIVDPNAGTVIDTLGGARWVNVSTESARPVLRTYYEPTLVPALCRQLELLQVTAPIIAGAGVTGQIRIRMRGIRLRQA